MKNNFGIETNLLFLDFFSLEPPPDENESDQKKNRHDRDGDGESLQPLVVQDGGRGPDGLQGRQPGHVLDVRQVRPDDAGVNTLYQ